MSSVTRIPRIATVFCISISTAAFAGVWAIASPAVDAAPTSHGFVWSRGQTTTIDHPDALTFTIAATINRSGVIVGSYDDADGVHGYVRTADGRFAQIDYPDPKTVRTVLHRINDAGQIVGAYFLAGSNLRHGFLLDGRTFIPINVPDAISTDANGINEAGQVTGWYFKADRFVHGMIWEAGAVRTIDATDDIGPLQTELIDINDQGQVVGDHVNRELNALHGVLVTGGLLFTTFDAPDFALTTGYGLNHAAQIAAEGSNLQGTVTQGYVLARGAEGGFTPFDVPGAVATTPLDITDDGTIVGNYTTATPTSDPAAPAGASTWPPDTRRAF